MGRPAVALLVSLLAPIANHLLTGSPAQAMLPTLTVQLLLFSAAAALLRRPAGPLLVLLTPLVYLGAVQAAPRLLGLLNNWISLQTLPALPIDALLQLTWPGLLVLALITWLMTRFHR